MRDIVNIQLMQSDAYWKRLQEQFNHIENEIESGKTVTLNLTDNDRTISLVVSRDKVSENTATIEPPATRKSRSLADNESLPALMTNTFNFDLGEANRQITPASVQAQIIKVANERTESPHERQTRAASGLPDPAVSYNGDDWMLVDDFTCTTNDGLTITVKSGFKTDLASIPRLLWVFIASFELSMVAPIVHDLIYRSTGKVALPDGEVAPVNKIFTREEADDLFLELMTRAKVRYWKRNFAYLAVRGFGESSWQERRID